MGKKHKTEKETRRRELKYFEQYLRENERSQATIDKYMRDARMFLTYTDLYGQLDKPSVLHFKEWLFQRYHVNSCNSMISSVNQYLGWCGREDLKIKGFRQQTQTILSSDSLMTISEYKELLQAARRLGNERLYMCMQMIVLTGARVSELKYFTVEAVEKGRVTVRNKGKIRVILIPDTLRTLLLRYVKENGIRQGAVMVTKHGKPLNRSNIWKEMQALKKVTSVSPDKIHPHNLRHLFARTFYQTTSDVVGLSDILGHSSLNVTRIYTSGTEDAYLESLNKMTKSAMFTE